VFESKVLRRIFGPRRDEVMRVWRKLRNEKIHNLYSWPIMRMIKSKRMRRAGHVARIRMKRRTYRLLVGKLEGKRPLGKPGSNGVHKIKIDLAEVGLGGMDWINMTQDRDRSASWP
jgi:hypothetical protein